MVIKPDSQAESALKTLAEPEKPGDGVGFLHLEARRRGTGRQGSGLEGRHEAGPTRVGSASDGLDLCELRPLPGLPAASVGQRCCSVRDLQQACLCEAFSNLAKTITWSFKALAPALTFRINPVFS